jgi:hypothetical protein
MNVGLPGTGIGGLFYLVSALCMPIMALVRKVKGDGAVRWRLVGSQLILATAIFIALALSWAFIDRAMAVTSKVASSFAPGMVAESNVDLGVAPTIITVVVLLVILGLIELAAAIFASQGPTDSKAASRGTIRHRARYEESRSEL